ncbi:MAG: ferritin family protein [Clostridiales bacterium]|nr:ferritin family protein [Clostridiales bacterium]
MNKNEISLIKQAIINEVEGYEFYKMAAGQAKSEEIKQALLNLSNEEMKHIEYLHLLFDKIKEDALDDYTLASIEVPESPHIFKWEILEKEDIEMTLTVFSIGMQMEKASVEFYTKAKAETQLEEAKKLYDILIKWEQNHLEQFSDDYEKLQEEWWANQGYAPF